MMQHNNNISPLKLQSELISNAQRKTLKKEIVRNYLIRLVAITLTLTLLAIATFQFIQKQKFENLSASSINNIESIDALIHNNLNFLENQVQIFASDPELQRYLITNNDISRQFILNSWQTIAERIDWFANIEYLPVLGHNNLGVSYDSELNEAFIKYDFSDDVQLAFQQNLSKENSKELYLSAIELNKKFNEPTYPLTPIMDIVSKINLGTKTTEGFLRVSILADKLLQPIIQDKNQSIGNTILLNDDGYYIKASNSEYEWGQTIHSRNTANFSQQLPTEWALIKQHKQGQISTDNGIFNFRVLSFNHNNEAEFSYFLVNQIDAGFVNEVLYEQIIQLFLFWLLLVVFSIIGLWFSYKNKLNLNIQNYSQSLISVLFSSDDAIFIADTNWQITSMNNILEQITGYISADILHKPVQNLIASGIAAQNYNKMVKQVTKHGFWRGALDVNSKTKGLIPCLFSVATINDNNGKAAHYVIHLIDNTKQKNIEKQLRLAAVALETNSGILITAPDGNILRVNKAFTRITGYSAEDVIGQNPSILSSGKHDQEFYQNMWTELVNKGSWQGEVWNKRKSGDVYPQWINLSKISNDDETQYFVATFEDITIRKELEKKLRSLASTDPLTNCLNRRSFETQVKQHINIAKRQQQDLSLILFDIDHFKAVNDNFGHDKGDEILVSIASIAKQTLRESDIIARWGGEEFLILLPSNDVNGAVKTAERLRQAFAGMSTYPQVTCSFGVTEFNIDDDLNTMVKRSDIALYEAKDTGRDKVIQAAELTTNPS